MDESLIKKRAVFMICEAQSLFYINIGELEIKDFWGVKG
jgi:hypothetical protein